MSSVTTKERGAARDGMGPALRAPIELWLAVVFMALAFGAGITIGIIAQQPETPVVGVVPANQVPDNFGAAPPLTQEQIQQGLPSGHPVIGPGQGSAGGTGSTGGAGTGSGATKGSGSDPGPGGKGSGASQQNGSSNGTG